VVVLVVAVVDVPVDGAAIVVDAEAVVAVVEVVSGVDASVVFVVAELVVDDPVVDVVTVAVLE